MKLIIKFKPNLTSNNLIFHPIFIIILEKFNFYETSNNLKIFWATLLHWFSVWFTSVTSSRGYTKDLVITKKYAT